MVSSDLINDVSIDRLYNDILNLQGIRHRIINPTALNDAANYIFNEFQQIGLTASIHEFNLDGFDAPFVNVDGKLGDNKTPELLITSHYDSIFNTPGADDNLSGVAIMLEVARILKDVPDLSIRFVSFTLEEGNPVLEKKWFELGRKYNLLDERYSSMSYHFNKIRPLTFLKRDELIARGTAPSEIRKLILDELKDELTENEILFYSEYYDFSKSIFPDISSWIGKSALVGSDHYIKMAKNEKREIKGVINLETIGYTNKRANSQFLPKGIDPSILQKNNTKEDLSIGDFALIIANDISGGLGQAFFDQAKMEEINLPATYLYAPMPFEAISKQIPDILRSDHAPFWREAIPALMVTDSANFRNPFYHTPGDIIETLDFDFMKKVCQTTIATAIAQHNGSTTPP